MFANYSTRLNAARENRPEIPRMFSDDFKATRFKPYKGGHSSYLRQRVGDKKFNIKCLAECHYSTFLESFETSFLSVMGKYSKRVIVTSQKKCR